MAILEVKAFEAEAEVLGKVRTVQYRADKTLLVRDLEVQEAQAAIEALSVGLQTQTFKEGRVQTSQATYGEPHDPPAPHGPIAPLTAEPKEEQPTEAPKEKPKRQTRKKKGASTSKKKKEAKKEEPKPEPEPASKEEPTQEDLSMDFDAPAKDDGGNGGSPPAGEDADLVAKTKDCGKLIDIVAILRDEGFTVEQEIIDACERIKSEVPPLRKIESAKLPDRIKRVIERLDA